MIIIGVLCSHIPFGSLNDNYRGDKETYENDFYLHDKIG